MSPKARFWGVYALCAAAVFVAAFILATEPFFLLAPPAHRSLATDARGLGAMVIIATVFGVGAMRRPIASLIGAVLASLLIPGRPSGSWCPALLPPFVWVSWLQGRLAYWVLRFLRFVHHAITRPAKPGPDGAAGPIPTASPRD